MTCATFSPDGTRLVYGTIKDELVFWDLKTDKQTLRIFAHRDDLSSIAFTPDGSRVATCSNADNLIKLWYAQKGYEIMSYRDGIDADERNHALLQFSPDGRRLVFGRGEYTPNLYGEVILLDAGKTFPGTTSKPTNNWNLSASDLSKKKK